MPDCDQPDWIQTSDHDISEDSYFENTTPSQKLEALEVILNLHEKMIDMQNEIDECNRILGEDEIYCSSYISFTPVELQNLKEDIDNARRKINGS